MFTHIHAAWKLYELGFIVRKWENPSRTGATLYLVKKLGEKDTSGWLLTSQGLINHAQSKMQKEKKECDIAIKQRGANTSYSPLTTAYDMRDWKRLYR